ncbi:hypothetical protein [Streptomyces tendae]|uniref:hypothetical protein n=1 Tax=Streptomyces tendae TaxID=1932 RepID=UPI003700CAA3
MLEIAPSERLPASQPSTKRITAYALAVLGLDVVHRSTIRALLPRGETKLRGPVARERWHLGDDIGLGKNKTSIKFGHVLQEFEGHGWVRRTPELVYVHDPRALRSCSLDAEPAVRPTDLAVKNALRAVRNDFQRVRTTATRDQIEQHHDEIRALLHLLHTPTGAQSLRPT